MKYTNDVDVHAILAADADSPSGRNDAEKEPHHVSPLYMVCNTFSAVYGSYRQR